MHSEAMNFVGGVNVAAEVQVQQGYGNSPVSMEQVLLWNPQIIIGGYDHATYPGEFYRTVWSDPVWSRIAAVRNREVYETPQYPFCWIDRPPSVNRIIGLKWLANLFYPDVFHYDMRAETRHFYATFYHVQLSETQLNKLLSTAVKTTVSKTK
jgi:iron complex transport system substrate-binding protein